MKKLLFALVFLLLMPVGPVGNVLAQEDVDEFLMDIHEEEAVHEFPEIKPETSVSLGYWFAGVSGKKRAAEYEYLENSPSFDLRSRMFPFPHRLFLDFCAKNTKDYLLRKG